MSRHSFASSARAIIRAAAQAERARQTAARREEAAQRRVFKEIERQARANEREAARQYLIDRSEEAEQQSAEISEREEAIASLLSRALKKRPSFDFQEVYETYTPKMFDTLHWQSRVPVRDHFLPKRPGILARIFSKKYSQSLAEAEMVFATSMTDHAAQIQAARLQFEGDEANERQRVEEFNASIEATAIAFREGDHDAIVYYYKCLMAKDFTEEIDAVSAEVGYARDSLHLVVDLELPDFACVPEEASFKYVKNGDRIDPVLRNPAKRKSLYAHLISQIALKCIDTIFRGSDSHHVECLTLNGMLDTVDPATGQDIRVCLLSVRITRDDFCKLNLRQVHPEQCLRMLKASVSRSPAELVPVKPIVELDMVDPRFIDSTDVLSGLDRRQNLMELTPGEFESLITNLFAKMGLDTRQTQASRDGGVDCVAFDQRPIFGGKVVIQAKRYKHTVGVSAVRDLFGTVQNEGASKGILVTTSGYGKASFEFAKGKPLELLDGGNLLHLLMEHAKIDAKIVIPESWVDAPAHGQ